MGTCRLCLSPADMNIFFEDRKVNLQKFLIYTNLKIHKNDGYPQHICLVCLHKLEAIITFIGQCEESDRRLRSDTKTTTNTIYNEFIDDLKSFNVDDERKESHDDSKTSDSDDNVDSTFDMGFSEEILTKQNKKRYTKDKTIFEKADYLCNTCGQHFIDVKYFEFLKHLKIHREKYQCDECPKVFTQKKFYINHKKQHESGQFACKYCSKQFIDQGRANYHMRFFHLKDKKFQCQQCQKQFKYPGTLRQHTRKHVSLPVQKTFTCNICDKIFHTTTGLVIHLRTHTGERPFPCNYCDSQFTSFSTRKEHERLHTGETPFKCPICLKGFAQRGNMKSHFKFNHRESNYKESMLLYKKAEELKKSSIKTSEEPDSNT